MRKISRKEFDDMMGYPQLSDSQLKAAEALGRSIRSRYPIEGLDPAARGKVIKRAQKEFERKVKGGVVIFVGGKLNFLHYNNMLRV